MSQQNDFLEQAAAPGRGFLAEWFDFLRQNKKWWMIPIVVVVLLVTALVLLSGNPVAPFIYTVF